MDFSDFCTVQLMYRRMPCRSGSIHVDLLKYYSYNFLAYKATQTFVFNIYSFVGNYFVIEIHVWYKMIWKGKSAQPGCYGVGDSSCHQVLSSSNTHQTWIL